MGGTKKRWFSFHQRSASATTTTVPQHKHDETPPEFICPITGFLMSDPVVVPSGQTFERLSVQVCRNLGYVPNLLDGTPDFSTVIPNLAMKSTIFSWCDRNKVDHPRPPDSAYVENVVRARMNKDPQSRTGTQPSKTLVLVSKIIYIYYKILAILLNIYSLQNFRFPRAWDSPSRGWEFTFWLRCCNGGDTSTFQELSVVAFSVADNITWVCYGRAESIPPDTSR